MLAQVILHRKMMMDIGKCSKAMINMIVLATDVKNSGMMFPMLILRFSVGIISSTSTIERRMVNNHRVRKCVLT